MMCKTCPYYVENNNGYEYCAYFCLEIQRIKTLEMCRWQRELILADNSGTSQYTKDKAQEIENIALEIRNINNSEDK